MLSRVTEHLNKYHASNALVRGKTRAPIGEYDDVLTLAKKRKLRWFFHVSMSHGLAKTYLQDIVNDKRHTEKEMGRQY